MTHKNVLKLRDKPKGKYNHYYGTIDGERYEGSTKQTNKKEAQKWLREHADKIVQSDSLKGLYEKRRQQLAQTDRRPPSSHPNRDVHHSGEPRIMIEAIFKQQSAAMQQEKDPGVKYGMN